MTATIMRYTNFSSDSGPLIPADGATVRLFVQGGTTALETKTAGSDGKVTFEDLTPGTYEVNGFLTINQGSNNGDAEVVLGAGDSKNVSVTLD